MEALNMSTIRSSKYSHNHYNLLINHNESFWEHNVAVFPRDRFLEKTYGNKFENRNLSRHNEYLQELINYPCLFLYEKNTVQQYDLNDMGYIGYITSYLIDSKSITINFVKDFSLSLSDIEVMASGLQINQTRFSELNRTHWSVKNTNIYSIIESHRSLLKNKNIITRPKVFFSYSRDLPFTSEVVENLFYTLKEVGVNVIYDKNDLRAGNNMNYFMESIDRDDFTKIYVFCDSSYIDKADNMTYGVGKETTLLRNYIYNHPNQSKVVPLFLDGTFEAPIFLKDVIGFDLSFGNWESGIKKVIDDIFQ